MPAILQSYQKINLLLIFNSQLENQELTTIKNFQLTTSLLKNGTFKKLCRTYSKRDKERIYFDSKLDKLFDIIKCKCEIQKCSNAGCDGCEFKAHVLNCKCPSEIKARIYIFSRLFAKTLALYLNFFVSLTQIKKNYCLSRISDKKFVAKMSYRFQVTYTSTHFSKTSNKIAKINGRTSSQAQNPFNKKDMVIYSAKPSTGELFYNCFSAISCDSS